MQKTAIVRRIDDLGRVVIPKEIRGVLRIREGDPLEISLYQEKGGQKTYVCFSKYLTGEDAGEVFLRTKEFAKACYPGMDLVFLDKAGRLLPGTSRSAICEEARQTVQEYLKNPNAHGIPRAVPYQVLPLRDSCNNIIALILICQQKPSAEAAKAVLFTARSYLTI